MGKILVTIMMLAFIMGIKNIFSSLITRMIHFILLVWELCTGYLIHMHDEKGYNAGFRSPFLSQECSDYGRVHIVQVFNTGNVLEKMK